ncbi:MAG: Coenzyme F420 hydrogenase/dehydrogenase, beta subunit C-terminal domain [Actinobacteria bacterium]|nr:Coenzyme F420 hydrogenase/dehydrogenase, beta subunit C-terminal domain [Actinomycetota bacterium]
MATGTATPRWMASWADLRDEVVSSGLCAGCAACVVSCPHDVLGYDGANPFLTGDDAECVHALKGCTTCTRACPRLRAWEVEADEFLFGRPRDPEQASGQYHDVILAQANHDKVVELGQDGGLVSMILIYCLRKGIIDAALVSYPGEGDDLWRTRPGVARTVDDVLAAAGSRYTFSPNLLAYDEAVAQGAERIALVGTGCMITAPAIMGARKAGKAARKFALRLGLLCSKTFEDAIFEELFESQYGVRREQIVKVNIKGAFKLWLDDGRLIDVPLKECEPWTRPACRFCPDFSAEHADISAGGIGAFEDWSLAVIRTDLGRDIIVSMLEDDWLDGRPAADDPKVLNLMHKLAAKSRARWPEVTRGNGVPAELLAKPGLAALGA